MALSLACIRLAICCAEAVFALNSLPPKLHGLHPCMIMAALALTASPHDLGPHSAFIASLKDHATPLPHPRRIMAALRSGLMFWLDPRRRATTHPPAITQPLLAPSGPGGLALPRRDARRAARALRAAWAAAARAEEDAEAAAVAADAEADLLEAGLGGEGAGEGGNGVGPARTAPAYEAPALEQTLPAVVVAVHEQAARRQQALAGEQEAATAGQPIGRPLQQPIPAVPAAPQPIPVLQAAAPPHPEVVVAEPHDVVGADGAAGGPAADAVEEAAGAMMVPPTPPAGNRLWASFFRGQPRG